MTATEVKAKILALLDEVAAGGEVEITKHGRTVARNMLGAGADHVEVPYFWTDLADWATLEYVGPAEAWDEEVVAGGGAEGITVEAILTEFLPAVSLPC